MNSFTRCDDTVVCPKCATQWNCTHESVDNLLETVDRLQEALQFILNQTDGECEHDTSGIDSCFKLEERTVNAKYGADMACPSCIAHRALLGVSLVYGEGRHAHG